MSGTPGRPSRLAQRLRRVLGRSSPTPPTTSALAPTPHQLTLSEPQIDQQFWDEVLELLAPQHRPPIREYTCGGVHDVASTLDGVYAAAADKKRQCEARRWTYTFRGKTIRLSDAVDSITSFLDRFKAVGDVAVNADPIHAGLPWAGIRLILQVRTGLIDVQDLRVGLIDRFADDYL